MPINGVIPAIGKHIAAGNTLPCGNKSVCTDKPPELRVIIAAVQIVQSGLGIVIVPPVAEGVFVAYGVAGGPRRRSCRWQRFGRWRPGRWR